MSYENHHFSINTFSEISHLKDHLKNNPTDILLLTEEFYFEQEASFPMAILLVENTVTSSLKGLPTIQKYQSGEKIIHQMMAYYTNVSCKELIPGKGKGAKLWGVYSPCGGSGKTTVAFALAEAFARQGEPTLFLSLEEVASYSRLFDLDGQSSVTDLLYHGRKRTDNLMMKFEGIQRVHKPSELKYIPPPLYPQDMVAYEDDWMYLIDGLLQDSSFEHIIIDFTSNVSIRNLSLMEKCQSVLLLTNFSYLQNAKVEAFLAAHLNHQKFQLLANLTKPIVEEATNLIKNLPLRLTLPFSENLYAMKGNQLTITEGSEFHVMMKTLMEVLTHA